MPEGDYSILSKIGINLADNSQPYIYQLLKGIQKTDKEKLIEKKLTELETPILVEQK